MPRKNGSVQKRTILPDPVYNSKLVTNLINRLMVDGKKGKAQKILYGAFEKVGKKVYDEKLNESKQQQILNVFTIAINNIMPKMELKARRVGASNLLVPCEVSQERQITLAVRWLVTFARLRNEKTMIDKLAGEIIDAANGTGGAVKRKEDMQKTADSNKAYAHYRW